MKKLFNFLKKSIVVTVLCLIVTTTITPPPIPDFGGDSEYGIHVIPGPGDGDNETDPFDDYEDD